MGLQKTKVINWCDDIILFSLYAIAFFLPISKAIIESFSILAIACFLIKKIIQREAIPKTHLNLAISIFLIICFFSIFISSNFKISSRTFFNKTVQNIAFLLVVAEAMNNERKIKVFIFILSLSAAILGIDGIYQFFTHKDFIRHRPYYDLPRIHATFPTPNDFACYLYTVIPFVLISFFIKLRFKTLRFLYVGLLILLCVCLGLTSSRGGWFAFVSIALFMSIWVRSLGILFLTIGIIVVMAQQFYYPYLKERLSNFFTFLDSSSSDRSKIWDAALKMFMYKPWVGVGLGTFMFNFSKFVKDYKHGVPYAHNCYLQMAAEIGILGLIAFLSILVLFFSQGIELLTVRQKTFSWYVLLATLSAVLGYSVQMAVDTIFYSLDLGILFWLLLGIGIAAMQNLKLETNQ